MEPKSSEASWAAPWAGRSSSESSSDDSSLSDPHSSSVSGRLREIWPVGCGAIGAAAAPPAGLESCCCVIRWNGFVDDTSGCAGGAGGAGAGGVEEEAAAAAGDSAEECVEDCDIMRKYGLRLSGGEVVITVGGVVIAEGAGAGGGVALRSTSWLPTWLPPRVGVDACGVIC